MYTLINNHVHKNGVPLYYEGKYLCGTPYKHPRISTQARIDEANKNLNAEYPLRVKKFTYNGFAAQVSKEFTKYKAKFLRWSGDPGVAVCLCSDGKERLIPSFAIPTSFTLPKDKVKGKVLFGSPSSSK